MKTTFKFVFAFSIFAALLFGGGYKVGYKAGHQPKPEAAHTAIVLSNSYFELDMPILYATNVYRREMSVVNSGTEKGKNWYDGTWKWYVLRDLNMEIDYLVVLYEGHGIAVTKLDNRP